MLSGERAGSPPSSVVQWRLCCIGWSRVSERPQRLFELALGLLQLGAQLAGGAGARRQSRRRSPRGRVPEWLPKDGDGRYIVNGGDTSLYDEVICDSGVEKEFVTGDVAKDGRVNLYVKLPNWFRVETGLLPGGVDRSGRVFV